MANVKLFDQTGKEVSSVELNEAIFGIEPNESVVFDVVISQRASLRQGTHAVKNRSAVSGGGRKPWRQKGTGRARQGSIRSPQWRGAEDKFVAVENLSFAAPKTAEFASVLSALSIDSKVLVILEEGNEFAALSARNLPNVTVATATTASVLDIVNADKLLVTKEAISTIEGVLA